MKNSGISIAINDIPFPLIKVDAKGRIVNYSPSTLMLTTKTISPNDSIDEHFPNLHFKPSKKEKVYEFEQNSPTKTFYYRFIVKPVEHNFFLIWIENITRESKINRINRVLVRLSEIGNKTSILDEFYQQMQVELNTLFDAQNIYIVLYEKGYQRLKLAYVSDTHQFGSNYPQGNTFALWVIHRGHGVILNKQQITQIRNKYRLNFFGPPAQCWMAVPLKADNEVVGVIAVQNYHNPYAYDHEDLEVLEFVSLQLAYLIIQKEREQELEIAKHKAEEADKLKSAFLANMSHEIRTPMNAILGFSELIIRENINQEKKQLYADYIRSNGKLLLTLIDDIIELSKIEAGIYNIRRQPVDLNKLFDEIHHDALAEKKRLKRDIAIIRDVNIDTPIEHIIADGNRLKQVLLNLISNAIKFTPKGNITMGYRIPNNATIEFFVCDTGIGIPKTMHTIIFERFRQVDDSAQRQYGGTGLGLAISKKLVELMGGKIWVESDEGKGSCFRFSLPLILPYQREQHEISKKQSNPYNADLKGKVILIVEDNQANLSYLSEFIMTTGAVCVTATTGLQALDYIKNNDIVSAILLDILLPDTDGFHLIKEIRTVNAKVPIIVQSAYAFSEYQEKAIALGADQYLTKPLLVNELIGTLSYFFSNSRMV